MIIVPDYSRLCREVAEKIAALVREKPHAVLGLATGTTPLGVYQLLSQWHTQQHLDFSQVTCFNLDEYYPMEPASPQSYHFFMRDNLFRYINCSRWFVPNGRARSGSEIATDCARYEDAIREAGGIDLQLLGIGRTGHIGFNEPGSPQDSRTRLVNLHPITREDAAESFGGLANVPTQAVTMGIGTILDAREIVLMASGSSKAQILQAAMNGPISEQVPASLIRGHPNATFLLDREAKN